MRHAAASLWDDLNVPMRTIQQGLGHNSIRTTERVCLGVLTAMLALRAKRGEDCGALAHELLALFAARDEYRACAEKLATAWDDGTILDFYA